MSVKARVGYMKVQMFMCAHLFFYMCSFKCEKIGWCTPRRLEFSLNKKLICVWYQDKQHNTKYFIAVTPFMHTFKKRQNRIYSNVADKSDNFDFFFNVF